MAVAMFVEATTTILKYHVTWAGYAIYNVIKMAEIVFWGCSRCASYYSSSNFHRTFINFNQYLSIKYVRILGRYVRKLGRPPYLQNLSAKLSRKYLYRHIFSFSSFRGIFPFLLLAV